MAIVLLVGDRVMLHCSPRMNSVVTGVIQSFNRDGTITVVDAKRRVRDRRWVEIGVIRAMPGDVFKVVVK